MVLDPLDRAGDCRHYTIDSIQAVSPLQALPRQPLLPTLPGSCCCYSVVMCVPGPRFLSSTSQSGSADAYNKIYNCDRITGFRYVNVFSASYLMPGVKTGFKETGYFPIFYGDIYFTFQFSDCSS